jgi:putative ABC transport system permease protein
LLSNNKEIGHLNLTKALIAGRLPTQRGEVLLSSDAFERLSLKLGDSITLIGGTVYGSMAMQNFTVVGSVTFGVGSLDKGAVIADISDIRTLLDMEGGAGEILGFYISGRFNAREAAKLAADFNARFSDVHDEFSPQMFSMMQQNNLGYLMGIFTQTMGWMGLIFVFILGIVLWNSGLMNGIRRYGEFGVRLAIGESKWQVYGSLLSEALVIGIVGSILGLAIGLAISLYFNTHGMDVAAYNRHSTILSENIIYTIITPGVILASFIPGVLSTLFGAALAGVAIFKRQTSQLFKELEA